MIKSTSGLPPINILIVDDVYFNIYALKLCLDKMGHHTEVAMSGMEAIERCSEKKFDLVFMDIHMPGMDGPETVKRIREMFEFYKNVPISAITADDPDMAIETSINSGMFYTILKPFTVEQLEDCFIEYKRITSGDTLYTSVQN